MSISGFYTGYFAGSAGNGLALFVMRDGVLVGADVGGVQFDGNYAETNDGKLAGTVSVTVPPNATIVQGVTAPPQGMKYEVSISIPANFVDHPYIELVTPFGRVNVRMVKMREI